MKLAFFRKLRPGLLLPLAIFAFAQMNTSVRRAPDFAADALWLDSGGAKAHHSIKGYRGQVLLIDFWEYTCINCIRDFAVIKRWYRKYHAHGFEVIGVHYGEFQIGHDPENVRRAAKRLRLPWPVVSDVNGSIWRAYDSQVWPNRYLVDGEGRIVMQVMGEGNNRQMEAKIRELLAPGHPEVQKIALDPEEKAFAPECGIPTQETYVGEWHGRGAVENPEGYAEGQVTNFRGERQPKDGGVILSGKWRTLMEGVRSEAKDASATAMLRYDARSVYAVVSVENPTKPIRVYLTQDGKPLSSENGGADVRFDQQGAYVEVSEPRMYYLLRNPKFEAHTLALRAQGRGFTLHSFTYGNNCRQEFEEL